MEKLGIDPLLIVVQIVNFVLLLIILKKVLYKPILNTIKNREKELSEIEKKGVEFEKEKQEFEKEKAKLLNALQKEKREVLEEAKLGAQILKKETIDKANREAKKILSETQKQALRDSGNLTKKIKEEANKLAVELAKNALAQILNEKDRGKSVEIAIKRISGF